LHRIFAAASALEKRGLIKISKVKIATRKDDPTERSSLWSFSAIGLAADERTNLAPVIDILGGKDAEQD
jgi:hypothetical protein